MAEQWPQADFVGVDIMPLQHDNQPPNCTYLCVNVDTGMDAFADASFDVVHLRQMLYCVSCSAGSESASLLPEPLAPPPSPAELVTISPRRASESFPADPAIIAASLYLTDPSSPTALLCSSNAAECCGPVEYC